MHPAELEINVRNVGITVCTTVVVWLTKRSQLSIC